MTCQSKIFFLVPFCNQIFQLIDIGRHDFPVTDLEQSDHHYKQVLGSYREYTGGSPPQFAILSGNGLSFMLRLVTVPQDICPNERQGGTWDVFFWVRNARALHTELLAKGADIVYRPIIQKAYQMEEFTVRDLEGYVLGFGQAMAGSSVGGS
jgi:hypothetical protein